MEKERKQQEEKAAKEVNAVVQRLITQVEKKRKRQEAWARRQAEARRRKKRKRQEAEEAEADKRREWGALEAELRALPSLTDMPNARWKRLFKLRKLYYVPPAAGPFMQGV